MRAILKARWFVIAAWIMLATVLLLAMPNFQDLVKEKGQISVPEGYSSSYAASLLQEMDGENSSGTTIAVVFHEPSGITTDQMQEIKRAIDTLKTHKHKLGIHSVSSHFDHEDLEKQFIAEDGQTIVAALDVQLNGREISEVRQDLHAALQDISVEHYFTGSTLIEEDTVVGAQEALKKTEWITLGFILLVLLLVFRSIITPLIPLITVGFTYLVSQAMVAFLVDLFNFPLSTFTQIFLVAILFGIGTDYCILLLSRYKEELGKTENINDAIVETYKTAGKTVFFSGLAVLVGFASIGFSTFTLYRSATAVAVGVAVLLMALYTIVPFLMSLLGKRLFWPTKGSIEHKQSGLWHSFGRFALGRPILSLLLVAILVIPVLLTYDGDLSFNSLDEIGDDYESVKGFNIIADSFQPGETLPGTLVIKSKEKLDTPEQLALLEKISRELAQVDGVNVVRSVTRPLGEELDDFFVTHQVKTLNDGLGEADNGLRQISSGLSEASSEIGQSSPELEKAVQGIGELIGGTMELKNGIAELTTGLQQIEQGIVQGHLGSAQLQEGVTKIQKNAASLHQSAEQLLEHYKQLSSGLNTLSTRYQDIETQLNTISVTLDSLTPHFVQLNERYPNLQQDEDYLTIFETVTQLQEGSMELTTELTALNEQLRTVISNLEQANTGYEQIVQGNQGLSNGLLELIAGMDSLTKGLQEAAAGQHAVVQQMPQMSNGLSALQGGQTELQRGFSAMGNQLTELTDGLDQSVTGLNQVTDGLTQAQSYLTDLSTTSSGEMAGMYIPAEAIENEDFQDMLDIYMSADRHIAKFDIVFANNPYSTDALDVVPDLETALLRAVKGTDLEQAEYGISGVTGVFSDLRNISAADYRQTVIFMLIGIFLILIILLKSLIAPIYLMLSLILCYYTSLAITEFIFMDLLGYAGMSWTLPFFGFVILIALGIDYSIFLMDRFREYNDLPVEQAMLESMKNMGTVIISAAIILAGTFAAMLPSGMLSLLQIATLVISGLLLYALVFLPFFVPVMVKLFGKANFWPFKQ